MRSAKLLDLRATWIAPSNDDIHSNGGKLKVHERTDCLFGLPRHITASIEYKNAAQDTIPHADLFPRCIKFLAQEGMTRPEQ